MKGQKRADRELIAATLAAAILSNQLPGNISANEDGAIIAVGFYHHVLAELAKTEAAGHASAGRPRPRA
jgi:hypothetical protein